MKRKLYFLAILSALALAILACGLEDGGGSSSGEQSPADVLFQDDFSDPSSGWDQYEGAEGITGYANGVYRILVNQSDSDYWANPGLSFTDVIVEVDAEKVAGPDDNDYGIICRYQDTSNFYFLVISSDGFYGIGKAVNGSQELISMANMDFSEEINAGNATNKIKAECIGSQLAIYVNGQKLIEVEDTDYASGDVGLMAGTFSEAGTDIYFDNFVVRKP